MSNWRGILPAAAIVFGAWQAQASTIINQGFNITGQGIVQFLLGNDSAAVAVPFYDSANPAINDNSGTELKPLTILPPGLANNHYNITFDSSAIFGGYNLLSATLFVDATGVDNSDRINVYVNGNLLGALANLPGPGTIPLLGGGYSTMAGENDNSVFDLGGQLANLHDLNNFTISFARNSGSVNLDGINIQAEVLPVVQNPEPATLLFLGSGLIGVAGFARRHRAAKAKASVAPTTQA